MSRPALSVLGPPLLELHGQAVEIGKRKPLALLVYLAVTATTHSRDGLATLLWPDYSQSSARTYLRQALYLLEKRVGEHWFDSTRETIGLTPEAALSVDLVQFRKQLAQTQHAMEDSLTPAVLHPLAEAVSLYRDEFLAGFNLPDSPAFDEWQSYQRESLRRELAAALKQLAQGHASLCAYDTAIGYARQWLALDPLHEAAHRCLMTLYNSAGEQAAALRQYAQCMRLLEAELGVPPDVETTALFLSIRSTRIADSHSGNGQQGNAGSDTKLAHPPAHFDEGFSVPSVTSLMPQSNLPSPPTPFIGREQELATLDAMFLDPQVRLITIAGPGGIGKTRLAVAAAERQFQSGRFANGTFFVSLAPLAASESIAPALAEALGFSLGSGDGHSRTPQRQLLDYLRYKAMLLVLDNFEHLADGSALVIDLLQAAPTVKILVTSRERLRVQEEQVFPIQGLEYPAEVNQDRASEYPAMQLFLQRARRVYPDFTLDNDNRVHVYRICQLVEGMPLGIELAAAWSHTLSPADMAEEIQTSLDFLSADIRDIPLRHRSIRAVFDVMWQRLEPLEQRLFMLFTLFRGGFTRRAAEQVAGASPHQLRTLAGKSLIHFDARQNRYSIHELVRQYGADKLAQDATELEAMRTRHSDYFVALLQTLEASLKGGQQKEALTEIEVERENVHLAWQRAVAQGQAATLMGAMDSMGLFYEWQGRYPEGRSAFHAVVSSLKDTTSIASQRALIKALAWQSVFARMFGDIGSAKELLQLCQVLLDSHMSIYQETLPERAFVLYQRGNLALNRNNADARSCYEQSLTLYRMLATEWEVAGVLTCLGEAAQYLGDYAEMQPRYEESLALYQALDDKLGSAAALEMLSRHARFVGRPAESERLARESYRLCQQFGNPSSLANTLFNLAQAVDWAGRHAEAQRLMQESAELYVKQGDRPALSHLYPRLGMSQLALGQFEAARASAYKGLAVASQIDSAGRIAFANEILGRVAIIDSHYDDAQKCAEGAIAAYHKSGMRAEEGRSFALLAYVFWLKAEIRAIRWPLGQALKIGVALPDISTLTTVMEVVALLLIDRGDWEAAVETHALVQGWRLRVMPRWHEDIVGRYLTEFNPNVLPVADLEERTHPGAFSLAALCRICAAWLERVDELCGVANSAIGLG